VFADVLANVGVLVAVTGFVLDVVGIVKRSEWLFHLSTVLFAVGFWGMSVACILAGAVVPAVVFGAGAAALTWVWWKNRRGGRGRRVLQWLGEKSRARRAALVERMTRSPIPGLAPNS
jgi:hypothetical protein